MKLIVGLGNPGKQYKITRHNAGFMVVDNLAKKFNFPNLTLDKKCNSEISKGQIAKKRALIAEPQTFMNNSGQAVQALLHYYKISPNDLVVIHDDKDIPLGEYRVQKDRGPAGHNGVRSIIESIGTQDFTRIRVGVGISPEEERKILDTAVYVLARFGREEQKKLAETILNVTNEIEKIATQNS